MRNALIFSLLFVSAPVLADWTKIAENNNVTAFIDESSVVKDGNYRLVRELYKFKARYGEVLNISEYDCKEKRIRLHSSKKYSEDLVKQEILTLTDQQRASKWAVIPSSNPAEEILKFVCPQ